MASVKDIVQLENERLVPALCGCVHLWQEGSFLRAYEWSAYLLCRFVHEFKVTRRQFKDISVPVVFVGFPKTSLQKFIPEGCTVEDFEEKHVVMNLPIETSEEAFEKMRLEFDKWIEKHPVVLPQQKEKTVPHSVNILSPSTLTEVMQAILAFPVESKSPIECMLFLAEMKAHIAHLV